MLYAASNDDAGNDSLALTPPGPRAKGFNQSPASLWPMRMSSKQPMSRRHRSRPTARTVGRPLDQR